MRDFKQIMKDIVAAKEQSELDLERLSTMPSSSQNVMLGKMRAAKENLARLKQEYLSHAENNSIIFIPHGTQQEEFVEIAKKQFGCYPTSIDSLYELIAKDIHPSFYENKPASSALFDIIVNNFIDVASEIGIVEFPLPVFNKKYNRRLESKEDLIRLIEQVINEDIGMEISTWYAIDNNVKLAMKSQFNGKNLPMMIYSSDTPLNKKITDFLLKRMTKAKIIDTSDMEINEESVKKALLNARKK